MNCYTFYCTHHCIHSLLTYPILLLSSAVLIAYMVKMWMLIMMICSITWFHYFICLYSTDTQFEDALIGKTFIFQFVNSFSSLFYIAFVKPYIPETDPCLDRCVLWCYLYSDVYRSEVCILMCIVWHVVMYKYANMIFTYIYVQLHGWAWYKSWNYFHYQVS